MPYPVVPLVPGITQSDPTTQANKVNVKAANTSPTLADGSEVVAFSPNNTGLPVNVPSIVQTAGSVSTGNVASLAQAFTNNNAAGNSIVVVCANGNNGTLSVADTAGNTYQSAIVKANSTTFEAQIFFSVGPATGGGIVAGANTVTVTNAGTAASLGMQIYEVSGLLTLVAAQPGQTSTGTGTGTTASTSAISSGSPNSLVFAGVAVGTTAEAITAVTGTPWTVDNSLNPTTPSGLFSFGSLSLFLHSPAAIIPQATLAASKPYAAVSAIFRPVVIGVQGTVWIGGYKSTNITTATTTLVKTGPGILHAIIINTPVGSGVIEYDDALTHTNALGTITFPATLLSSGPIPLPMSDIGFDTGLSITTTTSGMDITIVWK
jgi:hypothetical protein